MDDSEPRDPTSTDESSKSPGNPLSDSEVSIPLHELLAVREPCAPLLDHASLSTLFEVDRSFESKVTALGPRSAHAASLNQACENHSEKLNWSATSVGPLQISALSAYVSFTNRNLIALKYVALQNSSTFSRLLSSLSGNPIGPVGCATLGKALLTNNTLEVLDLSSCDLTGNPFRPNFDGLMALIKGLESNRSVLLHLNLANTVLQPTGVRLICTSVAFHRTLTSLNISNNQAGLFRDKQGYLGIANLLRYSSRLIALDMASNPLDRNARPALASALQENCTLTSLNVSNCGLDKASFVDQTTHQPLRVVV